MTVWLQTGPDAALMTIRITEPSGFADGRGKIAVLVATYSVVCMCNFPWLSVVLLASIGLRTPATERNAEIRSAFASHDSKELFTKRVTSTFVGVVSGDSTR
jgi:hypothetical protein